MVYRRDSPKDMFFTGVGTTVYLSFQTKRLKRTIWSRSCFFLEEAHVFFCVLESQGFHLRVVQCMRRFFLLDASVKVYCDENVSPKSAQINPNTRFYPRRQHQFPSW